MNICRINDCDREIHAKNLCLLHYQRKRNGATEEELFKPVQKRKIKPGELKREICRIKGCNRKHFAKGMCKSHYNRANKGATEEEIQKPFRKRGKNGTGTIHSAGYKEITLKGKKIYEHRFIMEQHLGRELFKDEHVHHINGDKLDNRIENLEIWSTGHPSGKRIKDLVAWAEEILARYKP
jgi:hypothetical protein